MCVCVLRGVVWCGKDEKKRDRESKKNVAKVMHFEFHKSTILWISTRASRLSHAKDMNERVKHMKHGSLVGSMTIV